MDLARKFGADYAIKLGENTKKEVMELTHGRGVDVIVDCVGAQNTTTMSTSLLAKGGALAIVGLFGNMVSIPVLPAVINEYMVTGSLWGNYNELCEVIELARQGRIKHALQTFKLDNINNAIDRLKEGKIVGRAVIEPSQ
jgi:propanol-preferring alcohol dehydrogenase